jgi:hypothetical protein
MPFNFQSDPNEVHSFSKIFLSLGILASHYLLNAFIGRVIKKFKKSEKKKISKREVMREEIQKNECKIEKMRRIAEKNYKKEEEKNGLIILSAIFGKKESLEFIQSNRNEYNSFSFSPDECNQCVSLTFI